MQSIGLTMKKYSLGLVATNEPIYGTYQCVSQLGEVIY
jgi:hypothetical protein